MSAAIPKAIGILGGTFDPVHFGHLRLAQEVAEALTLAEVRFIPGGTPPHRALPRTPAAERTAMVKLAIANNPLFVLDERETQREGLSYTYDTLHEVRGEIGATQPLVLIMGADAFLKFETWHRWRDIFSLAHIAVAHRPGTDLAAIKDPALAQEFARRCAPDASAVQRAPMGSIIVVPITALDISATAIREGIRAGRSVQYLLPASVNDYINHKYLFLRDN